MFQVSGFQPYLVSFDEGFEASSGAGGHNLLSHFMSSESFIAGCGKGFQTGFYGREGGVGDDRRKGMGFIPHHEVEWRLVGDRIRAVIVCKFGMGDSFRPRCRIIAAEDLEIGFYLLVYSLSFAIGLRMIGSGKG